MKRAERIARSLQAASIWNEMTCNKAAKAAGIDWHIARRLFLGKYRDKDIDSLRKLCTALGMDADTAIAEKSSYGLYAGELNNMPESICWTCRRAAGGDMACSWSALKLDGEPKFKPVEGWNAKPTVIKTQKETTQPEISSYIVISCPKYIPD